MLPIVMPAVIAFSTFSTRISRSTELARASRSSARERWRLWRGSFVAEPRDFSTSPRRFEDGAGLPRRAIRERSARSLVGVDQILRTRRHLGVHGDLLGAQRLGERDLLGVGARKGGLDLGGHPLTQLLGGLEPDLLEERREQPAPDSPRHAERPAELRRPPVEA